VRNTIKVAAGLTLSAGLAVTSIGAVPAGAAVLHVKPGQLWTSYYNHKTGDCEVLTIDAGHMFVETNGKDSDVGTYTGGGRTVTLTWTGGDGKGLTFTGTWHGASQDYTGKFHNGGNTVPGTFNPGVDPLGEGCPY
jgi:hypothetical protein